MIINSISLFKQFHWCIKWSKLHFWSDFCTPSWKICQSVSFSGALESHWLPNFRPITMERCQTVFWLVEAGAPVLPKNLQIIRLMCKTASNIRLIYQILLMNNNAQNERYNCGNDKSWNMFLPSILQGLTVSDILIDFRLEWSQSIEKNNFKNKLN